MVFLLVLMVLLLFTGTPLFECDVRHIIPRVLAWHRSALCAMMKTLSEQGQARAESEIKLGNVNQWPICTAYYPLMRRDRDRDCLCFHVLPGCSRKHKCVAKGMAVGCVCSVHRGIDLHILSVFAADVAQLHDFRLQRIMRMQRFFQIHGLNKALSGFVFSRKPAPFILHTAPIELLVIKNARS